MAARVEVEHHCSEELGDRLTLLLKELIALAATIPVVPHKVPAFSRPRSVAAQMFLLSAPPSDQVQVPKVMRAV